MNIARRGSFRVSRQAISAIVHPLWGVEGCSTKGRGAAVLKVDRQAFVKDVTINLVMDGLERLVVGHGDDKSCSG